MQKQSLTVEVPGKLMIAGEFAVLEPNQKLITMAVDRFVYATLEPREENLMTLHNLELFDAAWHYEGGRVTIKTNDPRVRFVRFALEIALNYLQEQGIAPDTFMLAVKSELDDASGIKYGLGSSAAVVTAVIKSVLAHHLPTSPQPELVFKLAAIAHVVIQGNGSGADIAASTYGGLVAYTSFQAEWLLAAYEVKESLTALVEQDWVYCSINRVTVPKQLQMVIGWTGKPASTSQLVKQTLGLKISAPAKYDAFLRASEQAVARFLTGLETANEAEIFAGIKQNRMALATVGDDAGVAIETPLLAQLADLADQFGGAGKLSGAGGGDCGIAFMPSQADAERLSAAWENIGIKPLKLSRSDTGARII